MLLKSLFVVAVYLTVIVFFYFFVGFLAFREGSTVKKSALERLLKEPVKKTDYVKQVVLIAIYFMSVLSVLLLLIKCGVPLRETILVVCWYTIYRFSGYITDKPCVPAARMAIQFLIATIVSLVWYIYPNWLTINVVALLLGLFFLVCHRNITLKQTLVIVSAIMAYDAFAVFGTKTMQAVASSAAGSDPMPILLIIPNSLALGSEKLFMIGLGDIVLPGLVIMLAMRKARHYALPMLSTGAIAGYVVGMLIALAVLFVFQHPQPATIYLMPGVFVGFLVPAWHYGLGREIFNAKEKVG